MKKPIILALTALFAFSTLVSAQTPLWEGKGRIAVSSDGNEHDDDDWAATPMTLALIASQGLQDKLVVYTYSDHIWGSNQTYPMRYGDCAYDHMRKSALGAKEWFGFDKSKFVCAVDNPLLAYKAMAEAINASSEEDPLVIIAAGPMQVIGEAMYRADKDKRQYVTIISHSQWNNNHAYNLNSKQEWDVHTGWTWNKMKEAFEKADGTKFVQILNQNGGEGYQGLFSVKADFDWIKTSPARDNSKYKTGAWDFLYERIATCQKRNETCFDVSDAGMAVFLFTGIQETHPKHLKELMENPK